jgi:hypothetical protein
MLSQRLAEESPINLRLQTQQILISQKRQSRLLILLSVAVAALVLIELAHLLS